MRVTVTVPRKKTSNSRATNVPERASRARQRQRLIDACISALHIHGPSHTTVEKVVAIADMSPGIVRFYFDSKDAMLLASLAYLANEFEERVMAPVAQLKDTPVRALEALVELYLDAEIASPRKVSVWYAFWGEASSRQEYLELCGQKDDDFAALVHELIERMIVQSGASHLDADGVALGLIGVLEVLWQGIAFVNEAEIDRPLTKQRALAYLRSVFPRQFAPQPRETRSSSTVPAFAYSDGALLALERESLFRPSWQLAGHEADIAQPGDFLTVDFAGERALVVRDAQSRVRAFRNVCRQRPHALVTQQKGHVSQSIECTIHQLAYDLDGKLTSGRTPGDLLPLDLEHPGRFILVRPPGATDQRPPPGNWNALGEVRTGSTEEMVVAANWKLVVEQWLDALPRPTGIQRTFLPPNQLLEISSSAALILQVIPDSPVTCRIRRLSYSTRRVRKGAAVLPAAIPAWLQQDIEVAESTQKGLSVGAHEAEEAGPVSEALAQFRRSIAALLPALDAARGPS